MTPVRVGELDFTLEALRDFESTVDQVYAALEAQGRGEELWELCPYFAKVWPAARGLAQELARLGPTKLSGKRVLEVGCGLALPSLVAQRLGADVLAVDFHPDVLSFLQRNAAHNQLATPHYAAIDWRAEGVDLGRFDFVLGSDILYEREHAPLVAQFLARHVAAQGRVLLADPGRAYLQNFTENLSQLGLLAELRIEAVGEQNLAHEIFIIDCDLNVSHMDGRENV